MQNHVVGIDVSKKTLDVCSIFGNQIRKKSFTNTESGLKNLMAWITKLELVNPHICMESTGCYSETAAEFLHSFGYRVSVVNPLPIKAFRMSKMIRQKTDSSDAEVIAKFCLQNNPRLWSPKPRSNKELHEINLRIDSLKTEHNRLINLLEKKYINETVQKSIDEEIWFVKYQIESLKNEAGKITNGDENLRSKFKLLTGIKGIGPKLALTILADTDVEKFANGKQYAAFFGVTPAHFKSGTSVNGKSHISKLGSARLRKPLYMAALVVKNHNPDFAEFIGRLEKKEKCAKVVIVAVMRKLLSIIYGILKNNREFDKKLAFGH